MVDCPLWTNVNISGCLRLDQKKRWRAGGKDWKERSRMKGNALEWGRRELSLTQKCLFTYNRC